MSLQSAKTFGRIVTLDPAATEIMFKLGLGERIVAVSHDSDFPLDARSRPVVSFSKLGSLADSKEINDRVKEFVKRGESLYEVNIGRLESLEADLIVTQDLCGLCAVSSSDVERAVSKMRTRPEVYAMTPPRSLEDILDVITRLGRIVGVENRAADLVVSLRQRIQRVRRRVSSAYSTPNVAYVEWIEPMEVSPSWVPEMLQYAHATLKPTRQEIEKKSDPWQYLAESEPDVLIVSPCSFKTDQTRKEMEKLVRKFNWREISAVRNRRAYMVDSDYLNRAGLRLVDGLEILARLIHPQIFKEGHPAAKPTIEELS